MRSEPEHPDGAAHDRWTESLHARLRALAAKHLRREGRGGLLQPTALVHETYLHLRQAGPRAWRSRTHFYAMAARSLRRILVEHARKRHARKRGGDWKRISMREGILQETGPELDLVALDEALHRLAQENRPWAELVELRFFGGMSETEVALELGVTDRTVRRRWEAARAWLKRELSRGGDP